MLLERAVNGPALACERGQTVQRGWKAELNLGFTLKNGKTVLTRRSHCGPLMVQRPFYPEDGVCHVYLLHPPGGVVAGDRLDIDITVANDGHALLTTPAAGKFYRSAGEVARQSVSMTVSEGAVMEWLPQETILFEGARLASSMKIELDAGARFIGWEVYVLGRPASRESFRSGEADLNWSIQLAGKPFYIERLRLDADAFAARWGLNGCSACATMFVYPASVQTLETVRTMIADNDNLAVSRIGDLLICRGIDSKADRLRLALQQIWEAIRKEITGRNAELPRIWAT